MLRNILYRIVKFVISIAVSLFVSYKFAILVCKNKDYIINKFKKNFFLLDKWMTVCEQGGDIQQYLINKSYKQIAVYGEGPLAEHFCRQLKDTEYKIKYVIDKSAYTSKNGVPMYRTVPKDIKVDVIIVTPIWDYINIKDELERQTESDIVSLEEVVKECMA